MAARPLQAEKKKAFAAPADILMRFVPSMPFFLFRCPAAAAAAARAPARGLLGGGQHPCCAPYTHGGGAPPSLA